MPLTVLRIVERSSVMMLIEIERLLRRQSEGHVGQSMRK